LERQFSQTAVNLGLGNRKLLYHNTNGTYAATSSKPGCCEAAKQHTLPFTLLSSDRNNANRRRKMGDKSKE